MSRFGETYDRVVLGHPIALLIISALVLLFFSYHASNFRLDASADSLMLEDDLDLIQYNETIDRYSLKDFLFVTFDPVDELFTRSSLDTLKRMRDELGSLDGVDSASSIFEARLLMDSGLTLASFSPDALTTLRDPDVDIETAKQEILDSPAYRNLLLSSDGQTTAIVIYLESDTDYWELYNRRSRLLSKRQAEGLTPEEQTILDRTLRNYDGSYEQYVSERHQIIRAIRAAVEPYREHGEIYLFGLPMIADDMMAFIKNDLVIFGFGVAVFVVGTLSFIFRRKRWVFLPLLSCLFAVLVMMGMLGLLNWMVTVISSNFISLMLILTLSMNIHLAVRFRQLNRDMPTASQMEIVSAAVRKMVWPCLYTALTTILAFGSLLSSGIKPVIDFGWMMTIGLSITFLTTFLLFPAVLVLLKKVPPLRRKRRRSIITGSLAVTAERYGNTVVIAAICLAVFSVIGISNLRVENSFVNYFSENTEIHQGMKMVDDRLAGTNPLDVLLDFSEPAAPDTTGAIAAQDGEPEFAEIGEEDEFDWEGDDDSGDYWLTPFKVDRIKKVHDYLEHMPEVGKVISLASIVRFIEQLNDGKPLDGLELSVLSRKLPDDVRSEYLAPYASVENNEARITLFIRDSLENLQRKELLGRIRSGLYDTFGLSENEAKVSGVLVLYNNMLQSLFRSQILTLGLVLSGIGVMLLLLFRSVKLAIIGIIPNLLAVGIVLGIMGLLDIPLDMMTITIAAITMGIAIDNSIHYIYRFREEYTRSGNYLRTLKICHQSVGRAILNTSITVIFGFSILVLSNFIPTIYFGVFTGLAMLIAMLAILALLPKLILLWRPF